MKITKELREYVSHKIDEVVPIPTSYEAASEVLDKLGDIRAEFREKLNKLLAEFIADKKKDPVLEGCDVSTYSHIPEIIRTDATKSPAVLQYDEDMNEYRKFKETMCLKVTAILSAVSAVDDLDAFILNIISEVR